MTDLLRSNWAPQALAVAIALLIFAPSPQAWAQDAEWRVAPSQVARSDAGMVVTASPLATKAGVRILEAGGNAVDAAVAAAFAVTVTQPAGSGIGGRTQILLRTAGGEIVGIDGTTQVPRRYPGGFNPPGIRDDGEGGYGYGTIGVPGTVAALSRALEEHGTMTMAQVLQPAIDLAEEGFVLTGRLFGSQAPRLREFEGSRRAYLRENGSPYEAGEILRQPDLATTLRTIAREGGDAFYRGSVARRMVEDISANGGYLGLEDLEAYEALPAEIVRGSYRGYELVSTHPAASGATTIQNLQVLEHFDFEGSTGSAEWAAIVAQALSMGFQDKRTDLEWGNRDAALDRPAEEIGHFLTSKEWAEKRAAGILRPSRGQSLVGNPPPADPPLDESTTHLSVADAEGNVVALTQSLGPSLGSLVVTEGLGFPYGYTTGPRGYLRSDIPGTRINSRQSPMIVLREGEPVLVLGASGGRRILSAVTQVTSRVIDGGLPLEAAMAAPRIHAEPAMGNGLAVEYLEGGWSPADLEVLRDFGFEIPQGSTSVANVSAILIDREGGVLVGTADPRGRGSAMGPGGPGTR